MNISNTFLKFSFAFILFSSARTLHAIPTDSDLLSQVYGETKTDVATWKLTTDEAKQIKNSIGWNFESENDSTLKCKVHQRLETYSDAASKNFFVTFSCAEKVEHIGSDCHACAPITGVALIHDSKVIASNKTLHRLGEWGVSASAKSLPVGLRKDALVFQANYLGMGEKSSSYFIATNFDKDIREVAEIDNASRTNITSCGTKVSSACYSFESSITFVENQKAENSQLFDMRVTRAGSEVKPKSKKPSVVDETKLYSFDGSHYKIQK